MINYVNRPLKTRHFETGKTHPNVVHLVECAIVGTGDKIQKGSRRDTS